MHACKTDLYACKRDLCVLFVREEILCVLFVWKNTHAKSESACRGGGRGAYRS